MKLKENHCKRLLTLLLILLFVQKVNAQHDSLILKNGDIIVGEIKTMDKGVLTIETDYSDKDFTIEWLGIKEIYSKSIFIITLTDGRRINGSVSSAGDKKNVSILSKDGQTTEALLYDVVLLKGLKSNFWSRLNANVDLGLSFTKANDLRQLTINSKVNYLADKWQLEAYYSTLNSSQDSIEATERTDAGVNYKYFLPKDWFAAASVNFLSNTEQALKLRTIGKLGAGKFLTHTNKTNWAAGAGLSFNNESFSNSTPKRNSLEGYVGTDLNMFDVGDLTLQSSLYVYPSFTESGRWRSDLKFDTKYEFPLDFYIKMGLTLNYDNRPAVIGNETDYVLAFTIGWEW